jgi:hypothetical protein
LDLAQCQELWAAAARAGWSIAKVFEDVRSGGHPPVPLPICSDAVVGNVTGLPSGPLSVAVALRPASDSASDRGRRDHLLERERHERPLRASARARDQEEADRRGPHQNTLVLPSWLLGTPGLRPTLRPTPSPTPTTTARAR